MTQSPSHFSSQTPDLRTGKIAFQGAHGAFSDMSCRAVFQNMETVPCESFEDAFQSTLSGATDLAMIPVDNSLAGRVADVHHLLPTKDLFIIGSIFNRSKCVCLPSPGQKSKT
jgi:prephenate dehydratase